MNRARYCAGCTTRVYPTELFRALDMDWHRGCFRCSTCRTTLSVNNHFSAVDEEGTKLPFCRVHVPKPSAASPPKKAVSAASKPSKASTKFAGLTAPKPRQLCPVCSKAVYPTERIRALRSNFHKACFRCSECSTPLSLKNFQSADSILYCRSHLPKLVQGLGKTSPAASSVGYRGAPPVSSPSARPPRSSEPDVEPEPANPFSVSVRAAVETADLRDADAGVAVPAAPADDAEPAERADDAGPAEPTEPADDGADAATTAATTAAAAVDTEALREAGFIGYATAVEAWVAEGDDELSFAAGDVLLVTYEDGESWWSGVVASGDLEADKAGMGAALLFPLSHVQVGATWEAAPAAAGSAGVPGAIALAEVQYDYAVEEEGELGLVAGQIIHVLSFDNDEWWTGVEAGSGATGLFPSMYVALVDETAGSDAAARTRPALGELAGLERVAEGWVVTPWTVEEDGELALGEGDYVLVTDFANDEWWSAVNVRTGAAGLAPAMCIDVVDAPADDAPPPAVAGARTVRVVFDRAAEDDDELELAAGDVITVLEETSESWWSGSLRGHEGLFPLTHVEEMDGSDDAVKVIAVEDYDAEDADELSFRTGDVLTLVSEDNDEWWTCTFNAHQGLAPVVYLERL